MAAENTLKQFYSRLEEIYRLRSISGLLGWDQQVCMPENAAEGRADQQETLEKIIHQRFTDPAFTEILEQLSGDDHLSVDDKVNLREIKRQLDRARKLPGSFVAEQARECSLAYVAWTKARPESDFAAVSPHLERVLELARREAELVGYEGSPYNALLDNYEPGARIEEVRPTLLKLAEELKPLIQQVVSQQEELVPLAGRYPEEQQAKLCARIAADIGYDFKSGRLDKTHHPFESSVGPRDVRITTRYDTDNYISGVYTTLHETGHALYEQGLLLQHKGTPLGSAVSLGIHESQSRLWENLIGRSLEFSEYLMRILPEYFPDEGRHITPEAIWKRVNRVTPSLIRVESDEVTYSLHVVIRMLLEEQLVTGQIKVTDLPEAWNEMYREYLGIVPVENRVGVLQDVHWYSGLIGYFPTYVLGNLYGAQMLKSAEAALPDLYTHISSGNFEALRAWLRTNVHEHGMRYHGPELIKRISGEALNSSYFTNYVKAKFNL